MVYTHPVHARTSLGPYTDKRTFLHVDAAAAAAVMIIIRLASSIKIARTALSWKLQRTGQSTGTFYCKQRIRLSVGFSGKRNKFVIDYSKELDGGVLLTFDIFSRI